VAAPSGRRRRWPESFEDRPSGHSRKWLFDAVLAVWCIAGAPSIVRRPAAAAHRETAAPLEA
jgi:hypothetical protein